MTVWEAAEDRFGRGRADILLFGKGDFRAPLAEMAADRAPREFFYGFLGLIERGWDARFLPTAAPYQGLSGHWARGRERVWARLTGISRRDHVLAEIADDWDAAKVMVSLTDHFSLTLGHIFKRMLARPHCIGLFHGLSDIEGRLPLRARAYGRSYIWRSLAGLDHAAFFSPADRDEAVARYGIPPARTSIFPFGVDTGFWSPGEEAPPPQPFVLSVGSDRSRDYATLIAAPIRAPVKIVTRLPVRVPRDRPHVRVLGDQDFERPLDNLGLRRLYRQASVVVVTLKDVFQPTGQSVCLQAMACGCPVVLSEIKGLWSPGLYRDGEHALLVPPADPVAMAAAVDRLLDDHALAARLGEAARRITLRHHALVGMDDGLEQLILAAPGVSRR